MSKKVTLEKLIQEFRLEVIYGWDQLDRAVTVADLYRPGLELAGFFTYHPVERLQLLGKTELSFIEGLTRQKREERLERLCHSEIPCFIVTRQLEVPPELIQASKKKKVPILRTSLATTKFASKLTNYLEKYLAPATTMHGVLVDVYGIGVLITGSSGIGKSETALELVKRGHRLVADDAVEITQSEEGTLVGHAPELIRYLLEIRGLGIINVMTLFGAGAVRDKKKISLAIHLEAWKEERQYDRLGLDEEKIRIIDTEIPKLTIPVRPGRNLAVIIEVAAMNYRLKQMGYHAAQQFVQQLGSAIDDSEEFD
ncbi:MULTISPECIES: HPr(Ser) kinase/phosphatase [Thermoactinomyces]|jgi:HPr kinase/phosphorylase|uniref:HPr(Ser) kinase/phosphatase n=1 Tax=Thermoactinomyces TaxID=2023 RepID=UPI0005007E6E|nr:MULTISPECIES: HPr(Ser) kinase/phosphatase [Thermoactinomyces]KFZ41407.1 serine kinase [Thermoactinomyces sp. Gus2-1]KYQ86272.1 serine kinase [Thermoactinomyces sp. AS95]MBH8586308.1 HPr kinase/phosphorylase [Thermoactinomyces sp. CICC 10520]MBI0387294.1 HPr kinase/phosphorylase [Thermoactinomyces sp. CICC 24227]MBI0392064.1 HPr kinase/phosphorylase [Thermoactinomyces sp. CICC 24226]